MRSAALKDVPIPELPAILHKRISDAAASVLAAEQELLGALEALHTQERAEKTMISQKLQVAFEKVADARRSLDLALTDAG